MSLDVPMPRIVHPDIGKLRTPNGRKARGEGSDSVLSRGRWDGLLTQRLEGDVLHRKQIMEAWS